MPARLRAHQEPFFFLAAAHALLWELGSFSETVLKKTVICFWNELNCTRALMLLNKDGGSGKCQDTKSVRGEAGSSTLCPCAQRSPRHGPATSAPRPGKGEPKALGALCFSSKGERAHRRTGACRDAKPQQAVAKTSVVWSTHLLSFQPSPANTN